MVTPNSQRTITPSLAAGKSDAAKASFEAAMERLKKKREEAATLAAEDKVAIRHRYGRGYPGAQGFVGSTAGFCMGVVTGALTGVALNAVDAGSSDKALAAGLGAAGFIGNAVFIGNKFMGDPSLTKAEDTARTLGFFVAATIAHVGMMMLAGS